MLACRFGVLCLMAGALFACSGEPEGDPQSAGGASSSGGSSPSGGSNAAGGSGGSKAGSGGSGSGGTVASSGGTGGTQSGSGGASGGSGGSGQAGSGAGGGNSGGGGNDGPGPTRTACPQVGSSEVVQDTIVVESGETFDGGCKRYIAHSSLGDGSQDEGQDPVFVLEDGARLINVVLGFPAADGIHTEGDARLENIVWEDVGEDALTIKGQGEVVLDGGSSAKASDKVFQINAPSTFRLSNFRANQAGKLIRQNGGTTFRIDVYIDHCDISDMAEAIFRTDSSSSTVTMTNTRYSDIGEELFYGVAPGNVTQSNNVEY